MAGRERIVNLRIRAQDDYSRQVQAAKDALRTLSDAQRQNAAAGVAATAKARQEVEKLRAAYQQAAGKLRDAPTSAAGANPLTDGVSSASINTMRTLQAQVRATRAEYDTLRLSTAQFGRALATTAAPTEQMKTDFDRAKASLAGLRLEMQRQEKQLASFRQANKAGFQTFNRSVTGTGGALAAGAAGAAGGSFFQRLTAGISGSIQTRGDRGPLGLRPYELTNLGYQLNDLGTQLASGTSFAQAFAQQIGQIAQIFPGATLAILRQAPALAGLAAVIVPLIAAYGRFREEQRLTTELTARLTASVDGANYNPAALTQLVRDLQMVGVAASDSKTALLSMISDGLPVERMQDLILVSRDLATVWGLDFTTALNAARQGFDGTYKSLAELDDRFNFLTAAQRENIRTMFEQGEAAAAASEALEIFSARQSEAADKARGEWSEAMLTLSGAWQNLLSWIASTAPFQLAIGAVNALISVVSGLSSTLASLNAQATTVLGRVGKAMLKAGLDPVGTAAGLVGGAIEYFNPPEPPTSRRDDGFLGGSTPNVSEAEQKAASEARYKAENEAREKAQKEEMEAWAEHTKSMDEEAAKATTARLNRIEDERKERERIATEQAAALAEIDAQTADNAFEAGIATQSELQQRQARAVRDAEISLAAEGLQLDAERRASIMSTTAELYKQEEAAKAAAKAASGGGGGRKAKTAQQLEDEKQKKLEGELNDLLERRKALLEQIEFHEERGETTQVQALEGQVSSANDLIETAIGNLRTFWATVGGVEADNALAKLDLVQQGLTDLGDEAITTGEDMNEMLADGGVDAVDNWITAIAEGENVLASLRVAFLEFAADFLRQIAQMILQQALLNALQGGGGANGGVGGGIASAIGSLFHSGGIVGGAGPQRRISAAWFANAPRYHQGGVAGLRPGEVPAILKEGEEVLTEGNARHAKNAGGQANIKIVNAFDAADMLERAMQSEAGQQVVMNFLRNNRRTVSATLGR